jgi:transitional endoplasmic reticulum ATPase
VNLDELAARSENYTGAEIAAVCNEAAMLSIRDFLAAGGTLDEKYVKKLVLKKDHFERALAKLRPRSKDELHRYRDLSTQFRDGPEVA